MFESPIQSGKGDGVSRPARTDFLARLWRGARGPARRGLAILGLVALALVMEAVWMGFPGNVTRWILAQVNQGDFFAEVGRLRLDPRGGLAAERVRVYRKGVIGQPFLEADEFRVLFRWFPRANDATRRVKEVSARHGVIRPLVAPPAVAREAVAGSRAAAAPAMAAGANTFRFLVRLNDIDAAGTWVEQLQGELQADEEGGRIQSLSGVLGQGQQRGAVNGTLAWRSSGAWSGRVTTSFDPHAVLPVANRFAPLLAGTIERFSFAVAPPRLDLTFDVKPGSNTQVTVSGSMQAANFAYQGTSIGFANVGADYRLADGGGRLKLAPLLLVIGGRNASGELDWDFERGRLRFDAGSSADIEALARIVGLKDSDLQPWAFARGTDLSARGEVDYRDEGTATEVTGSLAGPSVGYRQWVLEDYRARFRRTGMTNALEDVRGRIAGGSFTGRGWWVGSRDKGDVSSRFSAEIIHAAMDSVLAMVASNAEWRTGGRLYGNIELSQEPGPAKGLSGRGRVTLKDGRVFRIPFFHGFTALLGKVWPNVGQALDLQELDLPFEIGAGQVQSERLVVRSKLLTVEGRGSIGFDGRVAMTFQVRPMKDKTLLGQALQLIASPVSKAFEVGVGGTVQKPEWRLVYFSKAGERGTAESASAAREGEQ